MRVDAQNGDWLEVETAMAGTSPTVVSFAKATLVNRNLPWMALAALGLVDWLWGARAGLSVSGFAADAIPVAFLWSIGFVYRHKENDTRLADARHYAALWVAFSVTGAIFTYVVATMRFPLRDAEFAYIDRSLGFNWVTYFDFVRSHRAVALMLKVAYASMLPQVLGTIIYLSRIRRAGRNEEFLWTAMLSLLLTSLIFALLPAVGPSPRMPICSRTLLAIRGGVLSTISLGNLQGIISMPSFHTVMAVLLIYIHRPPLRSFQMVFAFDLIMLLSVPPVGNHYLVDLIAGVIVAFLSIATVRATHQRISDRGPATDEALLPTQVFARLRSLGALFASTSCNR